MISLPAFRWRLPCCAVVCLLGTSVLLGGCGGGGDQTITLWEQMDPEEREILHVLVAEYQAAHPGTRVEVAHYNTEDVRTQFQTAALGGGGPDLVFGPSDQVGPFSVMKLIHPIDEIFPADELARFRPEAFDTLDGHVWALPDQLGNHLTLLYNQDLIDAAPATMAEFLAAAEAATLDADGDGTPERYGLVFDVSEPFWLIPFLTGYGGWVIDAAGRPTLASPAMVRALELLSSLRNEHGVIPRECDYELADTMFKEGRAAMIINGPWSLSAYRKAGIPFAITRIPWIEETGRWPGPMISSKGYSVSERVKGEHLARVLDFLRFVTSTESQIEFATRLGTLPTRRAAYDDVRIAGDPVLSASIAQVEVGRRMPVVVEMRAIWDAMRPAVQSVWNGALTPAAAAQEMQDRAIKKIAEMRQ
ncbi:MAG: extracellular solute-binding protein [Candidatus Eisenbacteria sp.]|nr:extracellular solute-binding protein [Candidatus Eisenbacteria bacterium]